MRRATIIAGVLLLLVPGLSLRAAAEACAPFGDRAAIDAANNFNEFAEQYIGVHVDRDAMIDDLGSNWTVYGHLLGRQALYLGHAGPFGQLPLGRRGPT